MKKLEDPEKIEKRDREIISLHKKIDKGEASEKEKMKHLNLIFEAGYISEEDYYKYLKRIKNKDYGYVFDFVSVVGLGLLVGYALAKIIDD